ncbi:MAG: MEDS domain-containing protein, partial [Syntrophomonadaceae bacterium]|nr:MEDS domain-containing protein [Syntrophomonadaceae bacterium]
MIALPSTALLEKFRTLKPGNHICLIYENEAEWQEAVSAFLISGLEKNEKCICMVRKHTPEQVLMYLKARGLDITSDSIKKQLLIININSSPELKNSLNPETITALLGRESLQARSEGYAALRFTGEIGWMLGHSTQNLDKILHHVGVLNRDLFPNFRCVAMFRCFNKRYSNHTINEIVMAYPIYIKNNKIHYNTYCRLPHDLLENLEKELQEQLYFLQNLIDAIPNPVFFKGFDGKYQRCNRA